MSDNNVFVAGYAYATTQPVVPEFYSGNELTTRKLSPALGSWSDAYGDTDPNFQHDPNFLGGSAVLHHRGSLDEVIKVGRAIAGTCDPIFWSPHAWRYRSDTAVWTRLPDMNYGHNHCYAIALPDGRTLVEGGRIDQWLNDNPNDPNDDPNDFTDSCYLDPENEPNSIPAEIFDPYDPNDPNGVWRVMAKPTVARGYHHSAVLLPDGSVFVAGGGHTPDFMRDDTGQTTYEIYKPPYFFSTTARPVISSCPAEIEYAQAFDVVIGTPAPTITKVRLIRLGAATHSFDMDQRLVELSFTTLLAAQQPTIRVAAPTHGGVAPPGYYMLFICRDPSGTPSAQQYGSIPSIAKIVLLSN